MRVLSRMLRTRLVQQCTDMDQLHQNWSHIGNANMGKATQKST
ncbi:hypothetical protein F0726_02227 [Acidithiobacillus caldus]|nr:hypothetical protein F0726_02227 [Acidithiobacillus caldus]